MKNKITLLQLEDILPMVEYGIWLRVNGQANYISHNDIWNLLLNKYGAYIVSSIDVEGPLNDGGSPHIEISIMYDEHEETDKPGKKDKEQKLEDAGW